MKNMIFSGIILFVSLLTAGETLTVRSDNWMPFNGDPKDTKNAGYIIDVLREIFTPAGITVDYQNLPWARAIKETREGKYNAIIGGIKDDSPDFVFPAESLYKINDGLYTLKTNNWRYTGPASLDQITLGCVFEYAYDDVLMDFIKKNKAKVQCVGGDDPLDINIKKLQAGRVSVITENPAVMGWRLNEMKLADTIIEAGQVGNANPMYIAFSPKNPNSKKYAEIFDKGFKALKANGKLNEILKKYKMAPVK